MSLVAPFLLLLVGASGGAPTLAEPAPRPISAAERAAVELALAFADRGPAAWREYLAPDTPLGRLTAAEAELEISVRCGPARGASWQLQTPTGDGREGRAIFAIEYPSGVDETLEVELIEAYGIWAIAGLRTLVDPEPGRVRVGGAAGDSKRSGGQQAALLAWIAALLSLVAASRLASSRWRLPGRAAHAAGAGALALLVLLACRAPLGSEGEGGPGSVEDGLLRLAPLAELRAAIAAGDDRSAVESAVAALPPDPHLAVVADLWLAQLALADGDLSVAEARLAAHSELEGPALAHLLRARLAILRLRPADASWHYLRAREVGIDSDGLRLEAIHAERMVLDGSRSAQELATLIEEGTRLSDPWYDTALLAMASDRAEEAEGWMRAAWHMAPLPRRELFDDPLTAALVVRPTLFPLFELAAPEEPTGEALRTEPAMRLPRAALARTCGQELEVELGDFTLAVPGGAGLSGALTVAEGASARERRHEARSLADLARLANEGRAGSFTPRQLRAAEVAARALARRQRWQDLVELTDGAARRVAGPEATLLRWRGLALRRLGRDAEARSLLLEVARRQLASQRASPGTLYDLAEALAAEGSYDDAIRLIRRADSRLPLAMGAARIRQYELRREQERDARTIHTARFDIRAPRETGERHLRQISALLDQEARRLEKWIPGAGRKPIGVELYPVRPFLATYGGIHVVLGLFDGRMRVPFADLPSFQPELVAILSHELAHAMLAEATGDLAPRWFHEGLAQHVEMTAGRVNPMPDLARTQHRVAFSVLEPILAGFAEPQLVELAYGESAWAVEFIEARWGVAGLHRLERAFASGEDSEGAIRTTFGLSTGEFDRAFWDWGVGAAPAVHAYERVEYRYEEESMIEPDREKRTEDRKGWAPAGSGMAVLAKQQERERGAMRTWHERYASLSAKVKTAWRPVRERFRAGAGLALPEECEQLVAAARELRAAPDVFVSGDLAVDNALTETYQLLEDLGTACAESREVEARHYYAMVVAAFSQAVDALRPHGLEP